MTKKEKVLSRLAAGVSVAAMVFAMVPFQPLNAAEKGNEIMEVVCSYMDGRENAVMTGNVENLEDVSEDEVGYLEKETNDQLDDFTANAGNKNFTKYGQWYGNNGTVWCAMFVSWCANMAEVPTTTIPKYQSCTTGMNTFKNANCFYYSSTHGGNYTPRVGDIFFTGASKDSSSHTGIVVGVSSTQITVVDGNWSDQVSKHAYKLTDSQLIGFASPNY